MHWCLLLMLAASTLVTVTSFSDYGLMDRGDALTPLVSMSPVLFAGLVAVGTGPDASGFEELAGTRITTTVNVLLPVLTVLAVALVIAGHLAAALLQGGGIGRETVLHALTAVLGWTGLGIFSATILGTRNAWVLPAASLVPITLLGYHLDTTPRIWNISAAAPQTGTTLIAAAVFVGAWATWNLIRYRQPLPLVQRR